jgi:ketosteroid isomerase-like protein
VAGTPAIYAPEAQELLPDLPPLVGKVAIRAFYGHLMTQLPRFAHQFDAQEITVGAAGDLAVVRGTYRFTPDVRLPSQVQSGKFVGVWRRAGGEWRLAVNISNGDPPAPAPAAA